jgi:hypothetical protein
MRTWKRIEAEDGNCGGNDQNYPYLYLYGKNGKQYPRLVMELMNREGKTWISVNQKDTMADWWRNEQLPNELLDDFSALLESYKNGIKTNTLVH